MLVHEHAQEQHAVGMLMMSACSMLSALLLAAAATPTDSISSFLLQHATEPISSFRCNKAAFYPTAGAYQDKAGGTRHVLIPEAMCASVATDHEVLQALCCASTRVNCSAGPFIPSLIPLLCIPFHARRD